MRCGCPHCETFMIQEELSRSACVCPNCGYRCDACLGTGTALSHEDLLKLKNTDWFSPNFDAQAEDDTDSEIR
ncbi:MAG TPA: hypothetical protein PKJ47_02835 [Candidatus Limiplasma sp.]|nr:hypothetical protein [Candidatus Limiplasma sp.]